jgi:hypothetical protein
MSRAPCEPCRIFSEALQDATARLADASSRLADLAGTDRNAEFDEARRDVQYLRSECEERWAELERHRANHEPAAQRSQ